MPFNTPNVLWKSQWKTQQTIQVGLLMVQHPRSENLGHPPGKEPYLAKQLANSKESIEWIVEKDSWKHHLWSPDQLQMPGCNGHEYFFFLFWHQYICVYVNHILSPSFSSVLSPSFSYVLSYLYKRWKLIFILVNKLKDIKVVWEEESSITQNG